MSHPTILILAGEPSGDAHGAALVRALQSRLPGARWIGLGGPQLRAAGVELLAGLDRLAVMGIVELLPKLLYFRRLERRVRALIRSGDVNLVVAVDYPGFNLRAIRGARARGVPVLYYIPPKVWAWRAGRVRRLAEDTDRVAVILPFEEGPLRAAGVDARFVSHPLVDAEAPVEDRRSFARRVGLDPDRPWLALLPGSRRQEVERHLTAFLGAARLVAAARPDVQPVIARAPEIPAEALAGSGLPTTVETRALLRNSLAAIVKSGTGTLEAALEGVPFVAAYRIHPLTWAIARRLVRVPWITLPNLIANEGIVTELLQDDATEERLAAEVLPLMDYASAERSRVRAGMVRVREALGQGGASGRVAEMALELLARRGAPRTGAAAHALGTSVPR